MDFWSVETSERADPFFNPSPNGEQAFTVLNEAENCEHYDKYYDSDLAQTDVEFPRRSAASAPNAAIRIADSAFDIDYFLSGGHFVSRRLREVLRLGPDVVSYTEVDARDCSEAIRQIDYRKMWPLRIANPVDESRSPVETVTVRRPDGSYAATRRVQVGAAVRIYRRPDFVAPAPLFSVPWAVAPMVTDALADQVMRAGITDMVFRDVTSDRAQSERVTRRWEASDETPPEWGRYFGFPIPKPPTKPK